MNTFIFNLKDTTALSDSAVVELVKVLTNSHPMATEVETNCNDVTIVTIICLTIVFVALILGWGFWSLKNKEIKAEKNEQESKRTNSNKESARKLRADCIGKLLDFLEKNSSEERYDKENDCTIKTLRGIDSKESQIYINVLTSLINDGDIKSTKKN